MKRIEEAKARGTYVPQAPASVVAGTHTQAESEEDDDAAEKTDTEVGDFIGEDDEGEESTTE
jgi:hypothetical protein